MSDPILRLDSVTKTFGGLHAVDEVSFRILPGEIVGLIGPNGAGKTTIFNLISGYFPPTRGRIFSKAGKSPVSRRTSWPSRVSVEPFRWSSLFRV
jgi:ABC-type branched-subunit amino acid transport system ATPase component